MSILQPEPFEEVIRTAGEGWIIDLFSPSYNAFQHVRTLLDRVDACGRQRFGNLWQKCDEDALIKEYERNPKRVKAFLQALGSTDTESMLVMVWRILKGKTIATLQMNYRAKAHFSLTVSLSGEDETEPVEEYISNDIDDAKLIRHFSIMKMSDLPLFDGFYALQV